MQIDMYLEDWDVIVAFLAESDNTLLRKYAREIDKQIGDQI